MANLLSEILTGSKASRLDRELVVEQQIAELASRADLLSMMTTYFGDPEMVFRFGDRIDAVTEGDVQRVARVVLDPANRVTVAYVPAARTPDATTGGAR